MKKIINAFMSLKDDKYADFLSSLIPNIERKTIIGVRSPQARKVVKDICSEERELFMKELPHTYLEENTLHSFFISQINDLDKALLEIEKFLPYVDNWAASDSISPKVFTKDLDKVYKYIKKWLKSKHTYTVRFGICSLLQFYLNDSFKIEYNELVSRVKSNEYYINMAIAWYFSYALIKQYDKTIGLFESKALDKWVHNKSIQKAVESYRISDEKKKYLKSLRIK